MDAEKNLNSAMLQNNNEKKDNYAGGIGIRHLQSFIMFLCLFVAYSMRVNLSVAIVAMVDNSTNPDFEQYDWNPGTQSLVLSSFFWGYILGQVPGGQLAQIYGPRILLLTLIGVCSVLNLFTPLIVSYGGWKAICAFRAMQGLSQSIIFPCNHTMLSKWAPLSERARLSTFSYAGAQLGTVAMLSLSGFLAKSSMGWPSIFYVSGTAGILWTVVWYFLGSNSPADYKKIPKGEKEFIELSLGTTTMKSKLGTPWKSIFSSAPFYALIVVNCTTCWGFWTLLIEMPTYIKNVHGLDIQENALLTAMPYLIMWLLSFVFSYLSDTLTNKKILSVVASRKIFNATGNWTSMMMLIALGYVTNDNTNLAIVFLTIAIAMGSTSYAGYVINHMDIAPNYAGILIGITNFLGNCMSIISPLVVGVIITDETDPAQWRIIFLIAAGMYLLGDLVFIIFGKASIQKWNYYNTA